VGGGQRGAVSSNGSRWPAETPASWRLAVRRGILLEIEDRRPFDPRRLVMSRCHGRSRAVSLSPAATVVVLFLTTTLFCCLALHADSASAQPGVPDPNHCHPVNEGADRLGASPRNLTAPPDYRYRYVYALRNQYDQPVTGFPASLLTLDFSGCSGPSTRPLDQIPADGPSDSNGHVTWSIGLAFGGSDPCPVRVLVQWQPFHTIIAADPGGLRSPDENGDGIFAVNDLAIWQQAFVTLGSGGNASPYLCDCARPFDDLCTVVDLIWLQKHFTTGP
jgi:hypothetical protein